MLLAAIPEDWRLFFEFLAHTGLRISEAVGLTWEHVDLGERPHVKVREQFYEASAGSSRAAPDGATFRCRRGWRSGCSPTAATTTEARRRRYSPRRPGRRSSGQRPESRARSGGGGIGLAVEIKGANGKPRLRSTVSFHAFRHTCASMLFDGGRNVKQVAEWLGHADPSFTLRTYVHLMDAGVGDAEFLDEARSGDEQCRRATRAGRIGPPRARPLRSGGEAGRRDSRGPEKGAA